MKVLGLSVVETAKELGCAPSTLHRWRQGEALRFSHHKANLNVLYKKAQDASKNNQQLTLPLSPPVQEVPVVSRAVAIPMPADDGVLGALRKLSRSDLTNEELGKLVRLLTA